MEVHKMTNSVLDRPVPKKSETPGAVSGSSLRTYAPLTARDRCDAPTVKMVDKTRVRSGCGAQAFFRAIMPSGLELLFCGHHLGAQAPNGVDVTGSEAAEFVSNREAIIAQGGRFESTYETINKKPTDPSKANGF